MLHRVFVGVVNLQSDNECDSNDFITAVIDQCHLTLKMSEQHLRVSSCFILTVRRWLLFLNFCREANWLEKALMISSKF